MVSMRCLLVSHITTSTKVDSMGIASVYYMNICQGETCTDQLYCCPQLRSIFATCLKAGLELHVDEFEEKLQVG